MVDPVSTYPNWIGINLVFGGAEGVKWLIRFPYALPALLSGVFMTFIGLVVFLTVKETQASWKGRPDTGFDFFHS